MDRSFDAELEVPSLAASVGSSAAHFSRTFKDVFGETPHRYLQRRRVERAMYLLRETDVSVTDVCFDVGFNSLGTFSRTFKEIMGISPTQFRQRFKPVEAVPTCFAMAWGRPSSFGEARQEPPPYSDSTARDHEVANEGEVANERDLADAKEGTT
ncbi:MAG TPA: helix-turn-helix transcriptional regulator [Trueperaceae bacterium]|nr:helix-turn-helix transcriptional regulator [Trueperaceae bacterium]